MVKINNMSDGRGKKQPIYTVEEEQFLINNYSILGRDGCAEILKRTPFSIGIKTTKMGLSLKTIKLVDPENNKYCAKCKIEKNKTLFGVDNKRKDKLHPTCKSCLTLYRKTKEYKSNKRQYDLKYHKMKMKTDIYYRICLRLRKRMKAALKKQNKRKNHKTADLIGCNNDFFIQHLESLFKDGMTWDNYGKFGWHIDHIIPCAAFDLTEEDQQKKCFHYSNLQPLWWHENLSKKDKIIT